MNNYIGKQSVLNLALGEFKYQGFYLLEPDDHFTELWFKGQLVATYFQTALSFEVLEEACRNFLNNLNGGKS